MEVKVSKKKKVANKVPSTKSEELVIDEQSQPEPPEELPSIQVDEQVEQQTETEPQSTPELTPAAEVPVEPALPAPKPKPLTLSSLRAELDTLCQVVEQQSVLITQLMETPIRQRKPVVSNGKIQIKDTLTGKVYPSKNNAYQSLLKAGELKELVDKGVFGPNPEKNSFGCYNLFRAYPDRFEEVHQQEQEPKA